MSLHRVVITSLIAVSAATWTPLAAQSATQDTVGTTPPVVSARGIASTPSVQLGNAAAIDRALFLAPARATTESHARQRAPAVAAFRAAESSRVSSSTAMMIVGGAGLIVGGVVGGKAGTVIMVGGGVVGLAGLWNYLR